MTTIYERLYIESFSQSTLIAIGYLLIAYYIILAILHTLGGRLDWLGIGFYFYYGLTAVPLVAILLTKLQLVANPEINSGVRIFRLRNVVCICLWILSSWAFINRYFAKFAPSYLIYYSYPEGHPAYSKYGPPLVREQPFYLASFAMFFGLIGYFKLAWKHTMIHHSVDTNPPLKSLVVKQFANVYPRLCRVLVYSFGLLVLENIFFPPHTLLLYASFVGSLHPLRRAIHSFWEFMDIPLLYHLMWTSVSLCIMFTLIEIIVEFLFGRCFNICRKVSDPTAVLLSGLQSSKVAVRNQALLELRGLLLHDHLWREALFKEFAGEEALSKMLCKYFITNLRTFRDHIVLLNNDLKIFGGEFEKFLGERPKRENDHARGEKDIFSSRKRNLIENILNPIMTNNSPGKEKVDAPSTSTIGAIPDILEIKSSKHATFSSDGSPPIQESPPRFNNKYVKLALWMFGKFANSFPGRVYAALSCEMIKDWWIGHEDPILWLLDSLCAFITASYDEDVHGQVQFSMNDLLMALFDLSEALTLFDELPVLRGKRMLDDLFGPTPSPTERRTRTIIDSIMVVLEAIGERFSDSLDQLKLDKSIRERFHKQGIVI